MNKQIKALLLSVLMILNVLVTAVPALAAGGEPNVAFTVSVTEAQRGDTFTVTISTCEMTVLGFSGGIMFDKAVLECTAITGMRAGRPGIWIKDTYEDWYKMEASTVENANSYDDSANPGKGAVGIAIGSSEETTYLAADALVTVTFKVKDDAPAGETGIIIYEQTDGTDAYDAKGGFETKKVNITVPHDCEFTEEKAEAEYFAAEATCTTGTAYYKSCVTCGAKGTETFEVTGTALGHDYTEKLEDEAHLKTAANKCTEYNTYWYDCSRCAANAKDDSEASDKFFTSTTAAGDHIFTEKIEDNAHKVAGTGADCQDAVEYYFDCAHCAEISTTAKWTSETFGDHVMDTDWTTVDGKHFHACTVEGCDQKEDEDTCAGGTATCQAKAVCSECGKEYGAIGEHDFDTETWGYNNDPAGHAHLCITENCGAHDEIQEHTGMDEDKICDDCGYDANCQHESGKTELKNYLEATCGDAGYTGDICCVDCGGVITSGEPIPATGKHTGGEATCVAQAVCGVCTQSYGELDTDNHEWSEWTVGEAAECGKPGTETRSCNREGCGADETRSTDALEHDWSKWVETTAPGCTVAGEETRNCNRDCGVDAQTREVPALGHDWSEWTSSADATCGTAGEEIRNCTREVCDDPDTAVETRETAVLGHLWSEWEVITEPTCTEAGEKTRSCTRETCDAPETAVETEDIPALDHDWGNWVTTIEPTTEAKGEERRDCSRCEEYETRELEALEDDSFWDEWYWTMIMLQNQIFEIEADASEGGEITPDGVTEVRFSRDAKYIITPDEGYEIEAVYVDGVDVGAVESYTFKRVVKDHTIYAVFAEVEEEIEAPAIEESLYDDVDANDWFYDDVAYVTENGLMNGTGDDLFSPEVNTTRAMIVTILWRLEGEAEAESAGFTDVADDMWYTEAIDWAAANGIVNGFGDGTFGPEKDITREQVMAILHRYAAYKGWDDGMAVSMIAQYDCSVWAENDVNWADMNGILADLGVDVYDMTAEADRAEIAAYFTRFCLNVAE